MKVNDIITKFNEKDLIDKILKQYSNYPSGSLSRREVIQGLDFTVHSREEAEELMAELDATVSSAILGFQMVKKPTKR